MAMVPRIDSLKRSVQPICSVCIANYNGAEVLEACVESVLAQVGEIDLEIIVHDDASTDNSVDWLKVNYPQIILLESSENVGFCVANNRMVARARGHYVLLLNNDAALFPDAIESLLAAVGANPDSTVFTLPQYDWETGALVDRGCLVDPFYNPVPNLDPKRSEVAYGIGACLFLPRYLWLELGGFPEWMGSIGEDLYLCATARLRGHRVVALAASGYRHHQGASFGGNRVVGGHLSSTFRRRAFSERNKTGILYICTPTWWMWPLLGMHLLLLGLEGLALMIMQRKTRIWREVYGPAIAFPFCNRRVLRRLRRNVQATRRIGLRAYWATTIGTARKLNLLVRHGPPRID